MTLLDYFAAQALQGLMNVQPVRESMVDVLVYDAYLIGEAMLEERKRLPGRSGPMPVPRARQDTRAHVPPIRPGEPDPAATPRK